jgi:transposase
VAWVTKALDEVRRALAAQLRRTGRADQATTIKKTRWALLKNPPELTSDQRTTLAAIAKDNGALYRAYLLKEQLRMIFQAELPEAKALLAGWISWASRCRIPAFVRLAKTITRYRDLDPQRRRAPPVQRPIRSHQHPPTAPDPTRLRLPQPRITHRHGRPHPRRPLPTTPRTIMNSYPK